jgi:hypothetical protein
MPPFSLGDHVEILKRQEFKKTVFTQKARTYGVSSVLGSLYYTEDACFYSVSHNVASWA